MTGGCRFHRDSPRAVCQVCARARDAAAEREAARVAARHAAFDAALSARTPPRIEPPPPPDVQPGDTWQGTGPYRAIVQVLRVRGSNARCMYVETHKIATIGVSVLQRAFVLKSRLGAAPEPVTGRLAELVTSVLLGPAPEPSDAALRDVDGVYRQRSAVLGLRPRPRRNPSVDRDVFLQAEIERRYRAGENGKVIASALRVSTVRVFSILARLHVAQRSGR